MQLSFWMNNSYSLFCLSTKHCIHQRINDIIFISGSNLRAVYNSSEITTSSMKVWWNHPDQDADLVQSYNVSLREIYNSYDHNASAELQTNYTFVSSFTPSFLYVFEVSSNVMLNDPEETFIVKINAINLVVGKPCITVLYSHICIQ